MSSAFLPLSPKESESLIHNWTSLPSDNKTTYTPKPSEEWNPYEFSQIQTYNPLYSKITEYTHDPVTPQHINLEHAILPSHFLFHDLHYVTPLSEPKHKQIQKPMFIKFCPLLDPLRYLTGKYGGFTSDFSELKQLPIPSTVSELSSTFSSSANRATDTLIKRGIRKLHDPNNASYVDGFFYYLSSQLLHNHQLIHGIDFYGSFLAIQNKFRMNLYDDITYLRRYSYFNQNRGKGYHIYDQTFLKYLEFEQTKMQQERNSRKHHKVRLELSSICAEEDGAIDVIELLGVEDLASPSPVPVSASTSDTNHPQPPFPPTADESPETLNMDDSFFDSLSVSHNPLLDSPLHRKPSSDSEDDDDLSDDDDDLSDDDDDNSSESHISETENPPVDSEDNEILYAYIDQFPVQMICMETCEGTLDQLFVQQILNPTNFDTEGASMLFQVVATLIAYQKAFKFTHNDLHTNNIMWVSTPIQYLYYQIEGRIYRVPTYNRIYKIIDFGRAIYNYQGQLFCSDSFASPEGDASTQYNFEPYIIHGKPIIEPNPSFDLCRLACAIYDFLLDNDDYSDIEEEESEQEGNASTHSKSEQEGKEEEESVWEDEEEMPDTLFAQLIIEWCEDDKGRNMLYKKSGKERYPYFKLYQMIARTVHRHVPLEQIHQPLFADFLLPESTTFKKKKSDLLINLNKIPDCTVKI